MSTWEKLKKYTSFDPGITLPSIIIIFTVVFGCAAFPEITETYLTQARHWITSSTGWLFILGASFFVIFLLILCVSNLGNIRLGNDDDEPEHSFFSWLAMLFAVGMGIGLMFFGVAEPISHFAQPLHAGLSVNDQAKTAMLNTFFHWGIHAWAIYGVLGLALAYFGFRYHVPLTVRRAFFPILKDKVNGPIGRFIDVVALSCTIFGITTTLGYGALQLAAGFKEIHLIDSVQPSTLVLIILVCTSCSILSAISGVSKGVRYLSEINLLLAFGLMLFVLLAGPTVFTLNAFTENLGAYIANLVPLSFRTFAYDPQNEGWFTSWTVMYWAWWITWSPFVGMFIAKISKGRTIREFILGVLLVPTVFNLLWMTVFGNTAIWVDLTHKGILSGLTGQTESMLFAFLHQLPFSQITSFLSIVVITLFFVTSADSGIFVVNGIASSGGTQFPRWQSILWGAVLAALAILLLYTGGLDALQAMNMVMALPFLLILLLLCFCLFKGLLVDEDYFGRGLSACTSYWTGSAWQDRLHSMAISPDLNHARDFIRNTAVPAFKELAQEMENYGVKATVKMNGPYNMPRAEFTIVQSTMRNFTYGVMCQETDVSEFATENPAMPQINREVMYVPVSYFADGRIGYPVRYMKKEELIVDVLRQYDRFTKLATDKRHRLFLFDPED